MQRVWGYTEQGNGTVAVNGITATVTPGTADRAQRSYPSATVTVYLAGTLTLATIYSDNSSTAKANPFTADSTGYYFFYVANGRFDVTISGGGAAAPFTYGDVLAFDFTALTFIPKITWTLSETVPAIWVEQVGADWTTNHATSQPNLANEWRPAMILDLSTDSATGKQALYINIKRKTTAAETRSFTGIWIDSYFPPDNGSDVSGIHVINTGSGDAISAFHYTAQRPAGYAIQTGGNALELGCDHGDGLFISTQDNATDSVVWNGQGIVMNMGGTGATASAIHIVPVAPNASPPAGQLALWVSDQSGSSTKFSVTLGTGQTTIAGELDPQNNIVHPNAKGMYWNMVSGSQAYILANASNELELRGGSGGTRVLDNAGAVELFKVTDSGIVAISKTSNQILVGTSPDTTNLTFPAPSGPITLTFPNVAANIVGRATTETLTNKSVGGTAPTAGAGEVGLGGVTASTVGAAGGASALPATPTGYWIVNVAGTNRKIPYYAT